MVSSEDTRKEQGKVLVSKVPVSKIKPTEEEKAKRFRKILQAEEQEKTYSILNKEIRHFKSILREFKGLMPNNTYLGLIKYLNRYNANLKKELLQC